jgi:hypothetical protein
MAEQASRRTTPHAVETDRSTDSDGADRINELGGAVRGAADQASRAAADAAAELAARAPEAVGVARGAIDQASRRIDEGSDASLIVGAAFSLGLATGLLLGRGPRLLVHATAIPGRAMALSLLERMPRRPSHEAGPTS